jgi:hypothetical protein
MGSGMPPSDPLFEKKKTDRCSSCRIPFLKHASLMKTTAMSGLTLKNAATQDV